LAAFVASKAVFSDALNVVAAEQYSFFAVLQSDIHETWARVWGSTLETRLRYTPTDCFETFPFPLVMECLEELGERYDGIRRHILLSRKEGLTKTYNRFHDTDEKSEDIARLRVLHAEMDQAVVAAYGWSDLDLGHGFHETKQGMRYTISESARRTVLDRLLALNHQRYEEEVKAGLHEKKKTKPQRVTKPAPKEVQSELFADTGLDAAAFSMGLIVYIISASPGIRMSQLKHAFDLITHPSRMRKAASKSEKPRVEAWFKKWKSPAGPEWFYQTMTHLAGSTLRVTTNEDDPPIALVVQKSTPNDPLLKEGIELAMLVLNAGTAPELAPQDRAELVRKRRSMFTSAP
jgi:hypothetical protein